MKLMRQFGPFASTVVVIFYAFLTLFGFLVLKERVTSLFFLFFLTPFFFISSAGKIVELIRLPDVKLLGLLVLSCFGSLFLQFVFLPDRIDYDGRSIQVFSLSMMVGNCLWLFVGMGMSRFKVQQSNALAVVMLSACLAMVIPNLGEMMLITYWDLAESGAEGVNHLMVAEMLLLICFFAYSFSGPIFRPLAIVISAFLLFAAGGRSSFYMGVGFMVVYELFSAGRVGKLSVLIGAVLMLGVAIFIGLDPGDSLVQRMFFAEGMQNDDSYAERGEFLKRGLSLLPQQILIGDPGVFVEANQAVGSYIHNLISAWQFFGLVPFLLIAAVMLKLCRKIIAYGSPVSDVMTCLGALCFGYALIGVLFSKFVGFPFLWLAIGFWSVRSYRSS